MKDQKLSFKREFFLFYLIMGGMIFSHLFYVFFFYFVGSIFMSVFNVLSTVFFVTLFTLFIKKKSTKLLNRRAMKTRLEAALEFKKKNNVGFVTAIADIDDFKKINDRYGHDCGDKVLKKVVQIIKQNVRETDYISRWGGDEILILFNRSTLNGALTCIERIHKEIANSTFLYNNEVINLSITVGVCPSENYSYYQDIILEADRRLYDGKHRGKNCVVYETPLATVTDI